MPYVVEMLPSARRELRRLPRAIQERIIDRLTTLEAAPRPHGSVTLQGQEGLLRLRIGDYRVIYQIGDDDQRILVVRVAHRREAYRR